MAKTGHGSMGEQLGILRKDLSLSLRGLRKARGFAVLAVLSLGLGIGVNAALFTVAHATFMQPVPGISGADRIVELLLRSRGDERQEWPYPDFQDVRDAATPMEALAGWKTGNGSLLASESSQNVRIMYVSPSYFGVLGVAPARGRDFLASDGSAPVVILSHAAWKNRLGGDESVIGRTITLNRTLYHVIGIAPEAFRGHWPLSGGIDLWVPIAQHPYLAGKESFQNDRDKAWLLVLGRLRADATVGQANAALKTVFAGLAQQHPASNQDRTAYAASFGPFPALSRMEDLLAMSGVLALAGLVLLIICGNLAGMMLARGAAREREIAIRIALGATPGRIVRQLMTDSLVLALAGGGLGILVAFWGTRTAAFVSFAGLSETTIQPSLAVILGSLALVLGTIVVVGVFPAVRLSRPALSASLKDEAGSGGRRVGRVHRIAASAQAGISLLFLVLCTLFLRGLDGMGRKDLGFEPRNLLVVDLDLSTQGYESPEKGRMFLDRVRESVASLPGVTRMSIADGLPLDLVGNFASVSRADRPDEPAGEVQTEFTRVSEGFFPSIGIPLLRGRGIERGDTASSDPVVVITRGLADRLWPGEEALGRSLRITRSKDDKRTWTIVGVVGNVASSRATEDWPQIFVPLLQNYDRPRFKVLVRGAGDAASLTRSIQSAIQSIDPYFPVSTAVTSASLVRQSTAPQRVTAQGAGGLGLLTLVLSAIGVYGVVAFMVTSRTREIGLRMAIGATRGQVLRAVLWDAVRLTAPGLAVGGLLAAGIAMLMSSMLLGVEPLDPLSLGSATGVLITVVLLASLVPARRAAAIDPMDALRNQ